MNIRKPLTLAAAAITTAAAFILCPAQTIDEAGIFRRQAEHIIPVKARPDTVSLLFLGDIMMHSRQITVSEEISEFPKSEKTGLDSKAFDFSRYFQDISDEISKADLTVGNMEFTLAGEPYSGYPAFSAPDSFAGYLAECGFDILLTANNHILDKGMHGYNRTMSLCDSLHSRYGIMTTGSGRNKSHYFKNNPLITCVKGIKIAFVNFTYGTNASITGQFPKVNRCSISELDSLMNRAMEENPDYIIALPHWGEEYKLRHSEAQEQTARILVNKGADIIIGSHPHVVQDSINISKGTGKGSVPVTFSLGNAVSNMSARDTQTGLMLTIKLVKLENGRIKLTGHDYDYTWCSLPGRLTESHTVIKTKDYIDKRNRWSMPYEYDKMLDSYYRIQAKTGIKDRK